MFAAVCERAGYSDRTKSVKPVRVLDNLAFYGFRLPVPVLTEGHGINRIADKADFCFLDAVFRQKRAGIGVVFRMEKLVIVNIM